MIRRRLAALLLAAALLLPLPAAPAAAGERDHDYLALGASTTFGMNTLLPVAAWGDPAQFVGYPEVLAQALDLRLTNAACPGEASGGFIALTGADAACRTFYRASYPLHVRYDTAQLDFAVAYLRSHPRTRLVTLQIGANDLYLLRQRCGGAADPADCFGRGLPALLDTLAGNLATIYQRLRVDGRYHHQLVALTDYVADPRDATAAAGTRAVNRVVRAATLAAGGLVADADGPFQAAAAAFGGDPCAAGLLLRLPTPDLQCESFGHPSPAGRALLVGAILRALDTGRPRFPPGARP